VSDGQPTHRRTVLVTGGAGYIGSHAVKALAQAGAEVVVYDDLSAGHREAIAALTARMPTSRITLVEGDIADQSRLAETLRDSGATAVMHFAARLSVGQSVTAPLLYYATNVTGTLRVLAAMADCGVSQFVFSSTAATFGEPKASVSASPEATLIDETHPQRPINAYGESKLAVERALPHLERAHGIRFVALRYFNAAGADPDGWIGEDHWPEEHLIPRALAAADAGPALSVFGSDYPTPDGTCVRDFVHVSDLADAHLLALDHLERGGASAAYNLGNGHGASVRELIASVERVTGRPVAQVAGPRRAGDPAILVASSARIMRDLGWRPRLAHLDDIVATAWHWHRTHPRGYRTAEQD
jgi:UDP-glucose 4-epimerase